MKQIVDGTGYYLPKGEMKDYNVMTDGKSFDQPVRNDIRTCENIREIATGQEGNYKTGCLLDYPYFNKNYKLIAIDLSKQQIIDADPKAIQTNFIGNLGRTGK